MAINQLKNKLDESSRLSQKLGLHREVQDKGIGALLGLAAGESIGGPTQMASLLPIAWSRTQLL